MKFLLLDAMKVVKITTFDAVNNEIYLKITTFRF